MLKRLPTSLSKVCDGVLSSATVHDVVSALVLRSRQDEPHQTKDKITKVIVKQSSFNNVEVMALKLGLPRDTVLRLIFENFLNNPVDTSHTNP